MELFSQMKTPRYRIVLKLSSTLIDSRSTPRYEQQFTISKEKITIEYTSYKQSFYYAKVLPLLSWELPDKEADRAKSRDKSKRGELSQSPAFKHDIYNYTVSLNEK
jgi:hypothetical protein